MRRCRLAGRLAAAALLWLLAGCGADVEQAAICRSLLPAFEAAPERVEILRQEPAADGVMVRYRAAGGEHWIACRFAATGLGAGRLRLTGVATDRQGELPPVGLAMLDVWRRLPGAGALPPPAPAMLPTVRVALPVDVLYLLQQCINAVMPCAIYGLLALGYSLVYGIVGRINLAFGELYMVGGFALLLSATVTAVAGLAVVPYGAVPAVLVAVAVASIWSWLLYRLMAKPLAMSGTYSFLIASIGAAIFIRELYRMTQGATDRWLPPLPAVGVRLVGTEDFAVRISLAQGVGLALAASAVTALLVLLRTTGLGRVWRACADDPGMAALLGLRVERAVAGSFVVSGALAGLGGGIATLYYGGVDPYMGLLVGFKALVAAIVGGIGSMGGAVLGGLIIGLVETFWSAYLPMVYRDLATFSLLIAFLVLRPRGLLGQS